MCCHKSCRALQQRFPDLRIELRETQTRILIDELSRGALDAVLLALPIDEGEIETVALFDDPFLLAVPAADAAAEGRVARVHARDIDQQRLILLEEGHCLRDQALAFCGAARGDARVRARRDLACDRDADGGQRLRRHAGAEDRGRVELRDERVKVLRFRDPEPARSIGLAWRRTSPRKADFTVRSPRSCAKRWHETRRGDRRRACRPDGGGGAGAGRRAGDGLRPHAVGRPQAPDGGARRAQPDAQRAA